MTSQEFVIWLKGFTEGVHDFNITPKQWDLLKERLAEVDSEERISTPIGVGGWGTPNGTDHDLVNRYPWGGQIVWAGSPIPCSGSASATSVWTTNPNPITYTVTSGSAWSGGTTYTYPNGTTVSYTTGPAGANEFWSLTNKELLHD